jgi:hypothetical protein
MNHSIRGIINNISIYSIIVPLIVGCLFLKRLSRDSLIVLGIVALGTIPELLQKFTTSALIKNIAYNLYTPFEFTMLFLLYNGRFYRRVNQKIFMASVKTYPAISLAIVGYFGMRERFLNEWVCVNNICFTAWTLMFFTEEFKSEEGSRLSSKVPFFWYMTAYFFYAPCTLLLYSLWQFIKRNPDSVLINIWIIHNIFNTFMYVFFTVGFIIDVQGLRLGGVPKKARLNHAKDGSL